MKNIGLLLICVLSLFHINAQSPRRIIVKFDNRILTDTTIVSNDSVIILDFTSDIILKNASTIGSTTFVEEQTKETKEQNNIRTQCAAITKKGKRCSRMASPGSKYCWQHTK